MDKPPLPESVKVVHAPTLRGTPPMAGAYWIGGVQVGVGFCLTTRPRWLHRMAMRAVFGWEWRDTVVRKREG